MRQACTSRLGAFKIHSSERPNICSVMPALGPLMGILTISQWRHGHLRREIHRLAHGLERFSSPVTMLPALRIEIARNMIVILRHNSKNAECVPEWPRGYRS